MNRIVPIILLILLLILGGAYIWVYRDHTSMPLWTFSSVEKSGKTYSEHEADKKLQIETDTKVYNAAIQAGDVTLCDAIQEIDTKNRCQDLVGVAKAVEAGDATLCDGLSLTGITSQCRDTVAYTLAEKNSDLGYCQDITDANIRKNCEDVFAKKEIKASLASGSTSLDLCDTLSTDTLQDQCLERVQSEADMMNYRDALDTRQSEKCDTIKDLSLRDKCSHTLILDRALSEGDIELCRSLSDPEKAEYCQKTILARSDVSRYQEIIQSGDKASCSTLSVMTMAHQCHDTIVFSEVRTTQDDTSCSTLYNTGIIEKCRSMIKK